MKIALIAALFFLSYSCYGQKATLISGFIKNDKTEPVKKALVSVYHPYNNAIVTFAYTDDRGYFKIAFNSDTGILRIQVSALGYLKESLPIKKDSLTQTANFQLKVSSITLNEVVIKSKTFGVKVHDDTTTYKVKAFKNGTEKNVEDLLKKLPGVSVDENGAISFKGKKVDKVFIDGDDLLGKNYKLATRNINASFIDEVDAIENYTNNSLLKGIENGDKTVLNLKVDKNKKKILLGSVDASYGTGNFNEEHLNLFSYLNKAKIYIVGAHNNIGNRSSPDDNQLADIEKTSEGDPTVSSSKLITTDNLYSSQFKKNRINFNDESLLSAFSTYRPTGKLKIETNISIYSDHDAASLLNQTTYQFTGNNLFFNENDQLSRNPLTGNIKLNAEYAVNAHSNLKYLFEDRPSKDNVIQQTVFESDSAVEHLQQSLNSSHNFYHHEVNYTNRFAEKSAFILDANAFKSNDFQTLNILTNGNRFVTLFNPPEYKNQVIQNSNNAINEYNLTARIAGVKNRFNYVASAGFINTKDKLSSEDQLLPALADSTIMPANYINSIEIKKTDLFVKGGIAYSFNRLKGSINMVLHHLSISQNGLPAATGYTYNFAEPAFNLQYKFNDESKLSGSYSYNVQFPNTADLYSNHILTDYRTITNGLPSVVKQSNQTYRLGYNYDDFFSQFNLSANVFLIDKSNAYSNAYNISQLFSTISRIIVPKSRIYLYVMQVDKYINPLLSNIRLNVNYTVNDYDSKLNSDFLRHNALSSGSYKITYTTAFDQHLNFALGSTLNTNHLHSVVNDTTTASNNNYITGFFNLVFKDKKYFVTLNNDVSSINQKAYYFLDFAATYYLVKDKFSVSLSGKNLINNRVFRQNFLNDYEYSSISYKLIPAYAMVGLNYTF